MKKAAIWRAVSSKEQATEEKASLDAQLKSTTAAASDLGAVIIADLCIPGQSRNIPSLEKAARRIDAYRELVELVEADKITHLIVDRADRFGRHHVLTMQVYDLCDRNNVYVYDVSSRTLTAPGDDPLLAMVQAYSADRAVRTTSRNNLMGRVERARRGEFSGTLNYGYYYESEKDGTRIVKLDTEKAKRVKRMVELYLSNNGAKKVAEKLTAEFGEIWAMSTVYNMLSRVRVYAGQVSFAGQWFQGKHEPVINMESAIAVERRRAENAMNKNYGRSAQMFSRMVFCKKCNALMVVSKYRIEGKPRRVSYRCKVCNRSIAERRIKKSLIVWLHQEESDMITNEITPIDPAKNRTDSMKSRLREIEKSLERLDTRYVSGQLPEERYDRLLKPLEAEAAELRTEIANQPPPRRRVAINADLVELIKVAIEQADHGEVNALLREITQIQFDPSTKKVEFFSPK